MKRILSKVEKFVTDNPKEAAITLLVLLALATVQGLIVLGR